MFFVDSPQDGEEELVEQVTLVEVQYEYASSTG